MAIPLRRRIALVAVAAGATAIVLRGTLASALVTRGDEMLYAGQRMRALAFYRRALLVDENDADAVDRYVFLSMTLHRADALRRAVAVATRFLTIRPADARVRFDRALCEWRLKRAPQAERDFVAVARVKRDARAYVFAGYAAAATGAQERARQWWRAALALDAAYAPARRALSR